MRKWFKVYNVKQIIIQFRFFLDFTKLNSFFFCFVLSHTTFPYDCKRPTQMNSNNIKVTHVQQNAAETKYLHTLCIKRHKGVLSDIKLFSVLGQLG